MRRSNVGDPSMVRVSVAVVLLFTLLLGAMEGACQTALAETDVYNLVAYKPRITYDEYLSAYEGATRPDRQIIVAGDTFVDTDMQAGIVKSASSLCSVGLPADYVGGAVTTEETGYIEWEVNVPEEGLYNIEVMYLATSGRGTSIEREIQINGEQLFKGADTLVFHRTWGDGGPVRRDLAGNDVRPAQVEVPTWRVVDLSDSLGYEPEPYLFHFGAGVNRIRLISRSEPMAIAYVKLHQTELPPTYEEVRASYESRGLKPAVGQFIKVQGESAVLRSGPSLTAVSDTGDPTLEPYDPALIRLNSIGGYRWQSPGDWITWRFEVPADGLYQVAIKGKQDQQRGVYSSRRIYVDGKVPFVELNAVQFNYTDRYYMTVLGGEDEPYLLYLTKGPHELTMEVSLGNLAALLQAAEEHLYTLTSLYRSIIMITSANPDPLRSYELDKRVPGLLDQISKMSVAIDGMAQTLEDVTGQRGGQTAVLRDIARLMRNMYKDPEMIPRVLAEYRDGIGSLGTWVMNTRNQPLQIDYLIISSPGAELPKAAPSIGEVAVHEVKALAASFTHDYNRISDIGEGASGEGKEPIKVWMAWGRDQAVTLKQMIEDSFTPATGIPVDLELVTNMHSLLIPSTLAGTAPDVALGAIDMDLAYRGAVADLAQFPDFDEVAARFKKSAFVSCRVRDKVYGLPETQSFPVMFYRKDILAELGIEVPQTWDDVYKILPQLQKKHMDFGVASNMSTFQMFLYQKGVPLYKEDMVGTNLQSEAAIRTFGEMTDLFTLYMFPLQYDFVNRFRMGEMPLAIADYSNYNTLSVFAPELRGQWGFTLVPGTLQPDGSVTHTVPAGSTGAILLEGSDKKEEAWEFLKWWTSKETQVRYGRELEALMGEAARYATANVEAMKELPWRADERATLLAQWDWVEGTPPVLGGYYVTRQFDWLFRAVVIKNEPVRESVMDYDREINKEMARKREEYHYETDLADVDQKWKDLYWDHYTHLYRMDVPREELVR